MGFMNLKILIIFSLRKKLVINIFNIEISCNNVRKIMKKFGINSIRRLIRPILGLLPNEMNKE